MPAEGRDLSSRQTRDVARNPEIGRPINSGESFRSCRGRHTQENACSLVREPDAGNLHVRFDERDVEMELWRRYSGTARRKGRQQTNRTYCHRATSRLYRELPVAVGRNQPAGTSRSRSIADAGHTTVRGPLTWECPLQSRPQARCHDFPPNVSWLGLLRYLLPHVPPCPACLPGDMSLPLPGCS